MTAVSAAPEKTLRACHSEEAKTTKNLCILLKTQMPGSFASLRMTAKRARLKPASTLDRTTG